MIDINDSNFLLWLASGKEELFPGVASFTVIEGAVRLITSDGESILVADLSQPPVEVIELDPEQPAEQ